MASPFNNFRTKTKRELNEETTKLFLLFKKTYAEVQRSFLLFLKDAKTQEDRDFVNQLIKEVARAYLTTKEVYDKRD